MLNNTIFEQRAEFVDTLSKLIASETRPQGIGEALRHIHSLGIVHSNATEPKEGIVTVHSDMLVIVHCSWDAAVSGVCSLRTTLASFCVLR